MAKRSKLAPVSDGRVTFLLVHKGHPVTSVRLPAKATDKEIKQAAAAWNARAPLLFGREEFEQTLKLAKVKRPS